MRQRIYHVLEDAESDNKVSQIYNRFMLVCIVASMIPLCFKQTNLLFSLMGKITVSVFIFDYILRWITADYKFRESGKYPFSVYAIVDLLSILPSLTTLNSGFKLFRLFRLNKAFKTLRLLRYSKSFH